MTPDLGPTSLHLIELPDSIVEWIRGGKRGLAPASIPKLGVRTAAELIDAAIEDPKTCRRCTHSDMWGIEDRDLMCYLADHRRLVAETDFCSSWKARP